MKVLIDQNISFRIIDRISSVLYRVNCSTALLARAIIGNEEIIRRFLDDDALDCLELFG